MKPAALTHEARAQLRYEADALWLARHHDRLLRAADWAGVAGIAVALPGLLWMLRQCGPALLPQVFS